LFCSLLPRIKNYQQQKGRLKMMKLMKVLPLVLGMAFLSSCAKVGSEAWCDNMKETPKGEWSMDDATNFTKHCIKF
jgi:hypothetical protein